MLFFYSKALVLSHIEERYATGREARPQKKKARRRAIFAGLSSHTIFAAAVLNFRVRDGNGCDHRAIATRLFSKEGPMPPEYRILPLTCSR